MIEEGKRVVVLAMVLTIAILITSALASYSEVVYPSSAPEEPSHAEILGDIYGGTFTKTNEAVDLGYGLWTIFSNHDPVNPVTAYRINDLNGEMESLNIVTNGPDDVDQIWTNGITIVTAEARYADMFQSFGWNGGGLGASPDDYIELLAEVGQVSDPFVISGDFLWGGMPNDSGLWWSKNSLNSDGSDHMVTYKITGLETEQTVWLAFWEDLPSTGWDQDYQDFVIEVRAIPEPASMLLFGLGALALLRKRRT